MYLSKANDSNEKRSIISAQPASKNVLDPTDNSSNIKRVPAHYEQINPFVSYKF